MGIGDAVLVGSVGSSGGGSSSKETPRWTMLVISTSSTVASWDFVIVNTGATTVTLPASPATGDQVAVFRGTKASTGSIVIKANTGHTILGHATRSLAGTGAIAQGQGCILTYDTSLTDWKCVAAFGTDLGMGSSLGGNLRIAGNEVVVGTLRVTTAVTAEAAFTAEGAFTAHSTATFDNKVTLKEAVALVHTTKTSSFTATGTVSLYICTTALTATIGGGGNPPATNSVVTIKNNSGGTVIVSMHSGGTIDGASSKTLASKDSVTFYLVTGGTSPTAVILSAYNPSIL